MIQHHLHIAGTEVDLSLPASDIEKAINDKLAFFYQGLVTADYEELDARTCKIIFHRELPHEQYGIFTNCLGYIDCSMISGLSEKAFTLRPGDPDSKQVISPLLPWGPFIWYAPLDSFISLWKRQNELLIGETISRVKIETTGSDVTVIVKYPREKGCKYDDDVADLETELGDTLSNLRGQTLTFSLNNIGQVCQRPYIKKKSYMGLIGFLKKTYNIDLQIT